MKRSSFSHHGTRWLLGGLATLLILLLSVLGVQGKGTRAGWFSSGFQAVNSGPVPLTFTARFLDRNGGLFSVYTSTLAAGEARYYDAAQLPIPIPDTFTGTVSVEAPERVDIAVLHLSQAFTASNSILEGVPDEELARRAFSPFDICTILLIHNTSPTQTAAVDVTAAFTDGTPAGGTSRSIPVQATLALRWWNLGVPVTFFGSVTVLSDRPIEVNVRRVCRGQTFFTAPSDTSTQHFVPQLPAYVPGQITPTLMIQNANTVPVHGEVRYTSGVVQPFDMPAGGLVALVPPAPPYSIYLPLVLRGHVAASTAAAPRRFLTGVSTSAMIVTDAPVASVVQIVDERLLDRGTYAYAAFVLERATHAAVLPVLFNGFQDWWTDNRIWVRNVGSVPGRVTIRYSSVPSGTVEWETLALPPGQIVQTTMPTLPTSLGAAILVADQPIVALAGAYNDLPGDLESRHLRYRGLNFDFACQEAISGTFSWVPVTPTAGLPVLFSPNVSGTAPISYSWDLGDGTHVDGPTPVHVYAANGAYTVMMTATNCLGFGELVVSRLLVVTPTDIYAYDSNPGLASLGSPTLTVPSVYQGPSGWSTNLYVQNLYMVTTTATVTFYTGTTTPVASVSRPVAPYAAWALNVGTVITAPLFAGSAAVNSSLPFLVTAEQAHPHALLSYAAPAGGGSFRHCPDLHYNPAGWSSMLQVQNVGVTLATILAIYSDGTTATVSLLPNQVHVFEQALESHVPGSHFAATVSANGSVIALATTRNALGGAATYICPMGAGPTAYVPYVAKWRNGWQSTLYLQNPGSTAADVTITYQGWPAAVYTVTVAPGQVVARPTGNESFLPVGYAGSAVLRSAQPFVALVALNNLLVPGDGYAMYTADLVPSSGVNWPHAITGQVPGTMDTGIAVQGTATGVTTITLAFYDPAGLLITPISIGGQAPPFTVTDQDMFLFALSTVSPTLSGGYSVVVMGSSPVVGIALYGGVMTPVRQEVAPYRRLR